MSYMNESFWDRSLRVAVGIVLLILGWGGFIGGELGLALKILGFIPLATGLIGFCPLYSLFHFRTKRA